MTYDDLDELETMLNDENENDNIENEIMDILTEAKEEILTLRAENEKLKEESLMQKYITMAGMIDELWSVLKREIIEDDQECPYDLFDYFSEKMRELYFQDFEEEKEEN